MEPLQNVQEYNANNFASALTLENVTNSIYSNIRDNLFPSCIYITLFITSFAIIVKYYYPVRNKKKSIYFFNNTLSPCYPFK